MKKPLRCWLTFHDWRMMVNDEGERYKTCARCGAYRDPQGRRSDCAVGNPSSAPDERRYALA
jgi:hypothetical protein